MQAIVILSLSYIREKFCKEKSNGIDRIEFQFKQNYSDILEKSFAKNVPKKIRRKTLRNIAIVFEEGNYAGLVPLSI